jgi:hypothetical protein
MAVRMLQNIRCAGHGLIGILRHVRGDWRRDLSLFDRMLRYLPSIVLVICVLLVLFAKPCIAQETESTAHGATQGPEESFDRETRLRSIYKYIAEKKQAASHANPHAADKPHAKSHSDHGQAHDEHKDLHDYAHGEHDAHGEHGADHSGHGEHGGHGEHHISVPPMIGSVSRGAGESTLRFPIQRLVVNPSLFTIGAATPGSPLALSQPGPFNILDTTGASTVQQLQRFHRIATLASPPPNVVGAVPSVAVLNTTQTVGAINAAFATTRQPYDVVAVNAPPASYAAAVDGVFRTRTSANGQTIYDPDSSGALRSFNTETQAPLNQPLAAGQTLDAFYAFDFVTTMSVPSPSGDGLIGRTSVATNTTVVPSNRLYFDYSLINNAVSTNRRESFDRFTVGFERAINVIFEGRLSVEVRAPFAASLDHRIAVESGMGPSQVEFGNAMVIVKQLICSSENFAISGGLGLSLPTGSDVVVDSVNGGEFLRWDNETTHLKPFVAFAYVPDERLFMSGFFEYDTPAGTNRVMLNLDGKGLRTAGRLRDSSHILIDMSAGYWIDSSRSYIQRWAPTMELHFDHGMGDTSVISDRATGGATYRIRDISDDRQLLNFLVGATLDLDNDRYLSFGYVTGIGGDGSDSDGELRVVLNWPFNAK